MLIKNEKSESRITTSNADLFLSGQPVPDDINNTN